MWPTKRLISLWVTIALITQSYFTPLLATAYKSEDVYFEVTAYYSAEEWQSYYYNGDYYTELRVNGPGTHWASGAPVFEGMLAAPANYPFGTKIYFEGYGIAEVQDRWGAIQKAGIDGNIHDRIDIWMGTGEEGVQRARAWGRRIVKGKIVIPSAENTLRFSKSSTLNVSPLTVNPESSNPDHVKKLQQIMQKLWVYSGEIDGEYRSIQSELIAFQLEKGLISGDQDPAAGWYGPKTLWALKSLMPEGEDSILLIEDAQKYHQFNHHMASEKYKLILEYGELVVTPESDWVEVSRLQELMQELWEYSWEIDGQYASIEKALIDMQIKIWLLESSDDWGAGYFWNKTKSALWEYYEIQNDAIIESQSQEVIIEKEPQVVTISWEDDESIEDPFSILSPEEKEHLETAYQNLLIYLNEQESLWKTHKDRQLEKFGALIEKYLLKTSNEILRAKLLYFRELMQ
jgi:3D (Asp-Asp-Asp) domain-containing protein